MLADQKAFITISDLVRVHACPVRFYYERNETVSESDRYAVCKQVSYHLGVPLDAEAIWDEVLTVRPHIDPAMKEYLGICITACSKQQWKSAKETDVRVVSEKHHLAGMIDRRFEDGTFSIIRAAGAMPIGTYAADRLRIAAISLCLEEMTGTEVRGGDVEHIPDGVSRHHDVQPRDRRQVITAIQKYKSIMDGNLPEPPLNAPCNRCRYKEKCESSVGRRLSELL
ncbi:MAG: recombinase RecB [Methanomicrobiales archaeon]|nr:recombinase RecB [Methanomicrobiales archaeon]